MASVASGLIVDDLGSPRRTFRNSNGAYAATPRAKKNAFLHAEDPKHLELLSTLLELQALDIESKFDLPQIIVCGSQSSGKSSVLESITQIPFPRSENTCTRFVTKVTLRTHPIDTVEVRNEQAAGSQISVPRFSPITNLDDLASELQEQFERASEAILGSQQNTKFSRDVLSIVISGPDRPILQILDLPGLIYHDPSDKKNIQLVRDIVESEMKKSNSTILAVVAAHIDFKNQGILSLCEEHDSKGERTVGIITRPDMVRRSQAETCVAIAQGQRKDEVRIRHDWHVLRNRSSDELRAGISMDERDALEMELLSSQPWAQLGPENLGVDSLRTRLRTILFSAAGREFPILAAKTKAQLEELAAERKRLGGDNRTDKQKQDVFHAASKSLTKRTEFYVEGIYRHDTSDLDASHPINLRARIVEQSELFRDRVFDEGHSYKSQLELSGINPDADLSSIAIKSRVSAMEKLEPGSKASKVEIQEAKKYLDEKRGMELPGTFNPRNINDFFWKQSQPWHKIAEEHIGKTFEHCELYFKHATLMAFAPESLNTDKDTFGNHQDVADRVFRLICKGLENMKKEAKAELNKIEIDRTNTQLNFNPKYLAEYRQQRNARNATRAIDAVVKDAVLQNKDAKRPPPELNPNTLAELQKRHTQSDRTEEEADDFLRSAWIHYRFMRDCYIANVLTQVVERHFMRRLSDLIPDVRNIEKKEFQKLVEEDRDLERTKEELKQRSDKLQSCLEILERSRWA